MSETADSIVNAIESALAINRVAVRIPAFNATDPELWFSMIESSFNSAGVTTDSTKFGYVVSALDSKYALEVRDIILNPPTDGQYQKLKSELIKRLSFSQEQKTRRLLEHEEIGDRKPSQFLRHLRSLAGTAVPDTMLRTLWLGRLPQAMQAILATQKDAELDKVAELADVISDATAIRPNISETTENIMALQLQKLTLSLQDELATLRREIAELKSSPAATPRNHRYRSRSRSRPRSQVRDGNCWYHSNFGDKAKKCKQPCSYSSGNATSSR